MTLVIEWDDQEVTAVMTAAPPERDTMGRKIVTVLGALVALALATWGLRRLRAAA